MKGSLARLGLWVSVAAVIVALLILRITIGPKANDAVRTGYLLLWEVVTLLGLLRRWRGAGVRLADPGLVLQMELLLLALWFVIFAILLRPAAFWLEAITVASILLTAVATVLIHRRERERARLSPSTLSTPLLGLPAEMEATYWRVIRGETVTPAQRARLDRWVQRRPGWRNLFNRR